MTGTINFLTDIAILLAAAVVAVPVFQHLRMGAVSGFILAGVLVGPHGLKLINNVTEIGHLSELGVVLLLFIIGIELNPNRLWMMRRLLFGLGTLQFVCTSLVFVALAHFLFGIPIRTAALVGPALALSSTAFVLQLLTERRMLTSKQGRASIAILLLQDLAVVPLLALVSLLMAPELSLTADIALALGEAVLIIGLVVLIGRLFLHSLLHLVAKSHSPEVFTAFALLIVLATSLVMEHIGLSMAMGAFLAGLLIADSAFRHQIVAETQPFRGLFLGLFFMSMGMTLDLTELLGNPMGALGLVIGLMVLKTLIIWPLGLLFGLGGKSALSVAMILSQSGEFALVVFTAAFAAGLLPTHLFQVLLLMAMLSMLITPLMAKFADGLRKSETGPAPLAPDPETVSDPVSKSVVIIGFGRMGHRIGQLLAAAEVPFVAMDKDPSVIAKGHALGQPVFYGDAEQTMVLRTLGLDQARTAIVALDDRQVAERLVTTLRQNFPDLTILARGHNAERCRKLRQLGANVAVSETLETSIELARITLTHEKRSTDEIGSLVEAFRRLQS
ncbi:monovalent cation:proton antiporter-2 (CPA2) family protein [Magnetospira sp. QH-2]|uniref:monovalent cation:proton antiporter-2 (CPA2) family protein n=1 Tax=Magnetospira sp. (strain QH-2) TaxID=1288970 RepID=UPI0003E814B5|nr:monovalent cation:proton antiporter-2 (CPA2) family protein [Magnetospira sp. QH-2]CCQ74883.1 glutathione-regulated potassium-efflux system protein kefB [Magnetospira sp. QH-2]